jgi:hypothetical protein
MSVPLSAFDDLLAGRWLDAVLAPFLGSMGPLFVGIIGAAIVGAIYIDTDSIALPTVVAMLGGGLVVRFLPPAVQRAGFLLIFVGVVLAGSSMWIQRGGRR